MADFVTLTLNGLTMQVAPGSTVAAVMFQAGAACRTSVDGAPRAALCGMGICFECHAQVNGELHRRTCQLLCAEGMIVETQP